MIRVLLVSPTFPPRLYGGGEISAYLISQTLGMSTSLKVLVLDTATKQSENVKVIPIDRSDDISIIEKRRKAITDIIAECDVVLHINMDFYPLFYELTKAQGKTFVFYINNYSRLFDPSGIGDAGTLNYSREYLQQVLKDMIVCTPTQHLKGLMLYKHDIDAYILPPIAESIFWTYKTKPWTGQKPLELAFVGHDSIEKNSAILPRVIDNLRNRGIAARMRTYIQPDTGQPTRTPGISYWRSYGWGQRNAFAEDLASSHILLHPMVSYETFGRAVLEATQLGLPVVSTRCGGPEETLGKYGYFFDVDAEPESICESLVTAAEESVASDLRALRIEASHRFEEPRLRGIYARFINSL